MKTQTSSSEQTTGKTSFAARFNYTRFTIRLYGYFIRGLMAVFFAGQVKNSYWNAKNINTDHDTPTLPSGFGTVMYYCSWSVRALYGLLFKYNISLFAYSCMMILASITSEQFALLMINTEDNTQDPTTKAHSAFQLWFNETFFKLTDPSKAPAHKMNKAYVMRMLIRPTIIVFTGVAAFFIPIYAIILTHISLILAIHGINKVLSPTEVHSQNYVTRLIKSLPKFSMLNPKKWWDDTVSKPLKSMCAHEEVPKAIAIFLALQLVVTGLYGYSSSFISKISVGNALTGADQAISGVSTVATFASQAVCFALLPELVIAATNFLYRACKFSMSCMSKSKDTGNTKNTKNQSKGDVSNESKSESKTSWRMPSLIVKFTDKIKNASSAVFGAITI